MTSFLISIVKNLEIAYCYFLLTKMIIKYSLFLKNELREKIREENIPMYHNFLYY